MVMKWLERPFCPSWSARWSMVISVLRSTCWPPRIRCSWTGGTYTSWTLRILMCTFARKLQTSAHPNQGQRHLVGTMCRLSGSSQCWLPAIRSGWWTQQSATSVTSCKTIWQLAVGLVWPRSMMITVKRDLMRGLVMRRDKPGRTWRASQHILSIEVGLVEAHVTEGMAGRLMMSRQRLQKGRSWRLPSGLGSLLLKPIVHWVVVHLSWLTHLGLTLLREEMAVGFGRGPGHSFLDEIATLGSDDPYGSGGDRGQDRDRRRDRPPGGGGGHGDDRRGRDEEKGKEENPKFVVVQSLHQQGRRIGRGEVTEVLVVTQAPQVIPVVGTRKRSLVRIQGVRRKMQGTRVSSYPTGKRKRSRRATGGAGGPRLGRGLQTAKTTSMDMRLQNMKVLWKRRRGIRGDCFDQALNKCQSSWQLVQVLRESLRGHGDNKRFPPTWTRCCSISAHRPQLVWGMQESWSLLQRGLTS